MKASILLLIICMLTNTLHAQTSNPFKAINKKAKMVTLSNGKYVENFDDDVLQRIGSVIIDTRTKKIVHIMNSDSLNALASDNTVASRWLSLDPLAQKYPSLSPYSFCANNPILLLDLDGRVIGNPNDPDVKAYKAVLLKTPTGKDVWEHMESATKTIYIYTYSGHSNGQDPRANYLAGTGGTTITLGQYQQVMDGKEPVSATDPSVSTFNPTTGLYDNTHAWDNTVILVNANLFDEDASRQIGGGPDYFFHPEKFQGISKEELDEDGIALVVGEEAAHSLQKTTDYTNKVKDKNGKYLPTGKEKPYEKRQHEVEAKKNSKKNIFRIENKTNSR